MKRKVLKSLFSYGLLIIALTCSGLVRGVSDNDKIAKMSADAEKLKAIEKNIPIWQTTLDTNEIDEMQLIPGKGVLVGLIATTRDANEPLYRPYVLYDIKTGQKKWEYKRNFNCAGDYSIITSTPVLVISYTYAQKTAYTALNLDNGKKIWSLVVSANHSFTLAAKQELLIFSQDSSSGLKLSAIDLKTGKQKWGALEKEGYSKTDPAPWLNIWGDQLLLIGKTVFCHALNDGKLLWSLPDIGPIASTSIPVKRADWLIIPSGENKISSISNFGKLNWQVAFDQPGILTCDDQRIYIQQPGNGSTDTIHCLSQADGKLLWTAKLEANLTSHLLATEGRLAYTKKELSDSHYCNCEFLDVQNGKLIASYRLNLQPDYYLPDNLYYYPGRVVVSRENGIAAFRIADGKCLWFYQVTGAHNTLNYAFKEINDSYVEKALKEKKEQVIKDLEPAYQSPVSAALRFEEYMYQKTLFTSNIANNTSSGTVNSQLLALERQMRNEANQTMNIIRMSQNSDGSSKYGSALQGSIIIANSILLASQMAKQLEQITAIGALKRWQHGLQTAERIHAGAVQGEYYFRPYKNLYESWNLLVVNLVTGFWQELIISPYQYEYTKNFMNFLIPVYSSEDSCLMIRGIGLDASQWKPMKSYNPIIPYPSILAYQLKEKNLRPAQTYAPTHYYGYIDRSGKMVISPMFERAYGFSEGLGLVKYGGKYGYIDKSGRFVIKPQFDDAADFSNGMALVITGSKKSYIDKNGRFVDKPQSESENDLGKSLSPAKQKDQYGYTDNNGQFVIQPRFEEAKHFSEGLARVKINGNYGFIDPTGKMAIAAEFLSARDFHEGLAAVEVRGEKGIQDNKLGYIDKTGKYVIEPRFEPIPFPSFCRGRAPVKLNDRYGYVDTTGKIVVEPQYDYGYEFSSNGMAMILLNKKYGYINTNGDLVIQPQFEDAWPFFDTETAARVKINGQWKFIDASGQFVAAPKFSEGLGIINDNNRFGYIDQKTGQIVIKPQFSAAEDFQEGLACVKYDPEYYFNQ